ncbi:unnamed protein product, partial [Adineta steineri]
EDNRRLALQLEQEKNHVIQQRDDAFHQIEQMRQLFIHNMRLLPNDNDLMQLTVDEVQSLQTRLQQELSKLTTVEQTKSNNTQQTVSAIPGTSTVASPLTITSSSPNQKPPKQHSNKNVLVSSSSKH